MPIPDLTDTKSLLKRCLFECRKTKTKVITLTNHNSRKQFNEPIRAQYMSHVPSAGKRAVLILLLIGRGSGARFFNQSQSVAMQTKAIAELLSTLN